MFHGININKEEVVLDGSEAPIRIDAKALLSSEKLAPAAVLNKVKWVPCVDMGGHVCLLFISIYICNAFSLLNFQVRIPYRPIEAKLRALPTDRDKLPSGKQILALTLTSVPMLTFVWFSWSIFTELQSIILAILALLVLQLQVQIGRWS